MPTPTNPTKTLLVIYGASGLPLYAARGLTQTLEPIQEATQIFHDLDGEPMDFSNDGFRRYQSQISCQDVETPALDGVWPGMLITVDCVLELLYLTSGGLPSREVVPGSSRTDSDYTFYRPRIRFMIRAIRIGMQEYQAIYNWQLDLVEHMGEDS